MDKLYIELNAFVKLRNLAATGGSAKILIRSGTVLVNGAVETKNKRKLYSGDIVEYNGLKFPVEEDVCRMQ